MNGIMSLPPVRVIHDDAGHTAALAEYEAFFDTDPQPGTPEGDRFELLGLVIATYEDRRWPIAPAEPRDVIRLVMEGRGYSQTDLAQVLGSRSRASEILAGRRGLSVDHIRALSREWRIPAAALIGTAEAA
ncbi:type II toxin-antitoxin system HigA family antitoxin [soil metagenome]